MSRVHPSSKKKNGSRRLQCDNHDHPDPLLLRESSSPKHTTLTVWKRSSMSFHGTDGFTVYDCHGRLAFRVDNYSRQKGWSCSSLAIRGGGRNGDGCGATLVLMDGSGKPLLSLKPQNFNFQSQWNGCIYKQEGDEASKKDGRLFMMCRPSSTWFALGRTQNQQVRCEAEVFLNHNTEPDASEAFRKSSTQPDYIIEGSFGNRNCKIRSTANGEVAAKIMKKRIGKPAKVRSNSGNRTSCTMVLSEEVFSLVVNPGFDTQLIMAFVVILDRICVKPFFTPFMCS